MDGTVRIAVDIGGTFTDLQFVEESTGRTTSHKTATTPDNPADGLVTGLTEAMALFDFSVDQISGLMHGTTIATNAVLQRRFPKAALLTTLGFEDIIQIGRHVRTDIYSQIAEHRPVLIARRHCHGIRERVDAGGRVIQALDESAIVPLIDRLLDAQIDVVAISLLHSYANSVHEQRLAQMIQSLAPQLRVSLSSVVSPELREYERTSTTVLNALLMPVVGDYMNQLRERLTELGLNAPVYLVQSNGGVTTPEIAAEQPARLLLSGPSGGARAVEVLASQVARPNLIAIDLGGTSFDVSVIREGNANLRTQGEIDGIPVRLPMLEIRTIGAGGGSIALVDAGGRLTVGPQSAGAVPGPVAYGRGGEQPTLTDANVVLGRVDPDYFLGGRLSLDIDAARAAIDRHIATPLALSTEQAAGGIIDIAVNHMAAAIRLSLYEKGLDPIDFALVSFGGAGGLHAASVARELSIDSVLYPLDAGTQSAWGMLYANVVQDVAQSQLCVLNEAAVPAINNTLKGLQQQASELLDRAGIDKQQREYRLQFDMRYPGQGWEIGVDVVSPTPQSMIDTHIIDQVCMDFHRVHQEQFAHQDPAVIPELVTLRVQAIGHLDTPRAADEVKNQAATQKGSRSVLIDGQWQSLPIYDRLTLGSDSSVVGPAIIEEPHSTIYLPPGWQTTIDSSGVLIATTV